MEGPLYYTVDLNIALTSQVQMICLHGYNVYYIHVYRNDYIKHKL